MLYSRSNTNLIFFSPQYHVTKNLLQKYIHLYLLHKYILPVFLVLFSFSFTGACDFYRSLWNYFRSKIRRPFEVEPISLSYSQIHEFRVSRFLYERTKLCCTNRIKKTLSSLKLAESLQANETAAVHLNAAHSPSGNHIPFPPRPLFLRPIFRRNNMDFLYPIGDIYLGVLREASLQNLDCVVRQARKLAGTAQRGFRLWLGCTERFTYCFPPGVVAPHYRYADEVRVYRVLRERATKFILEGENIRCNNK